MRLYTHTHGAFNENEINVIDANQKKDRNVGLDILRIIAMIMILILHYLGKGRLLLEENNSPFYYIFYNFLEICSIVAVNCYVLISGYFLVDVKFKWKKVFRLWGETLFYSVTIYLLIIMLGLKQFAIKDIIKSFFPILTKSYWFINIYFLMYILSPFLNKLINVLDKKEFEKILIILIIVFSVISGTLPDNYSYDNTAGYGIIWFICLYFIAGYIKKYGFPKQERLNGIICIGIYMVCAIILVSLKLLFGELHKRIGIPNMIDIGYNNILVLIESLALFFLFKNIKIKNTKIIKISSFIAPLTFGVYSIHEQIVLRSILYRNILHTEICYHNPYSILIVLVSVISIFTICILIEFIRHNITKRIVNFFENK